jgi:hypothetical protein
MSMKQHIQRYALLTAGVVIFLSYVNKAVFTHSHILPDGRIIVHAHPYLKHHEKSDKENVPVRTHHHTPGQYCLLSHHILYFSAPVPQTLLPVHEYGRYYLLRRTSTYKVLPTDVFRIRPPPTVA